MQMQPIGTIASRGAIEPDRAAGTSKPAAPAPEPAVAAEPAAATLRAAVNSINKTMEGLSQQLQFSIDDDSKRVIVKVIDQQTKEVIRQMPSVEALEIAKALDRVQGLLIRQKA